ncbi:MAG: stage III sporulation protein AE [Clostridia bacterium]|nr:stage III sporulation protein AE [Clostridia bacterium]MDY4083732.1 stage III sporulation protein AE [Eubacteriales bacterium]
MKKILCKILVILSLLLSIIAIVGLCVAESADPEQQLIDNVEQNVDDLDLGSLQGLLQGLDSNLFDSLKDTIKDIAQGEQKLTFDDAMRLITQRVFSALTGVLPIVVSIVGISLITSLLNGLTSGFLSNPTKELIGFVSYCAIAVIILTRAMSLVNDTAAIVGTIKQFMQLVFPILLTIITVVGGANSSAVFQPMMSVLTTSITTFVVQIIMPMVVVVIVFTMISSLSNGVKLSKLTSFFSSGIKYSLTAVFSLFVTFLTAQGLTGGIIDTVSIKTAKFAMQSYVPIVGGYLSDGFDLMMASFVLIKNSLGLVSLFALLIMIASPLVNIIVFSLGLKLASGIIEPIGDSKISKMIFDLSKNVNILLAIILGVAFMFVTTITLIIYACNLGVV